MLRKLSLAVAALSLGLCGAAQARINHLADVTVLTLVENGYTIVGVGAGISDNAQGTQFIVTTLQKGEAGPGVSIIQCQQRFDRYFRQIQHRCHELLHDEKE